MQTPVDKDEEDQNVRKLANYIEDLGLNQLASDILDEKWMRRKLEAEMFLNSLAIEEVIEDKKDSELFGRLLDFQSSLFDKAASYNNIVVTLGYAGFFAIWNYVNDSLAEFDRQLIAILLGISLMIFILWALTLSWKQAASSRRTFAVYVETQDEKSKLLEKLTEVETDERLKLAKYLRIYPYVFFSSSLTGFLAGFLLLALLFAQILGFEGSLMDLLDRRLDSADPTTN